MYLNSKMLELPEEISYKYDQHIEGTWEKWTKCKEMGIYRHAGNGKQQHK